MKEHGNFSHKTEYERIPDVPDNVSVNFSAESTLNNQDRNSGAELDEQTIEKWTKLVEQEPKLAEAADVMSEALRQYYATFGKEYVPTEATDPKRLLLAKSYNLNTKVEFSAESLLFSLRHLMALDGRSSEQITQDNEKGFKDILAIEQNIKDRLNSLNIGTIPNNSPPHAPERAIEVKNIPAEYKPQSRYTSAAELERFGRGEISASRVFSYDSVDEHANEREAMNDTSTSVQHYGDTLKKLIKDDGSDIVARKVEKMSYGSQLALEALGVQPSAWTKDGTWALWDLAKQRYFQEHSDEQWQHIKTKRDHHYYLQQQDEFVLVGRQVAWDYLNEMKSRGELSPEHRKLFPSALIEIMDRFIHDSSGKQVRSSNLAAIGTRLMEWTPALIDNVKYDTQRAS